MPDQPSPAFPPDSRLLVVGLGNIGARYQGTRHNVGFDVVDALARGAGVGFRASRFHGEQADIRLGAARVLLLKPNTLMNLSGDAVAAALRFHHLPLANLLVVCDDVHLPLGTLRLRARGSDGGHNGLWHIANRIPRGEFARLRIGVGEPPDEMDMADYVLSRFLSAESPAIAQATVRAADAVRLWAEGGTDAAANRVNARAPRPRAVAEDADLDGVGE